MGTLGGNIVRPHPFNHLPPALLALDARLRATDGTRERVLSFADTLEKGFPPGLLLTEVLLGADTRGLRTAAGRLAPTRTSWESAASCAVALEIRGGRCERAAIAVGAVLQRAARMGRAEKALEGRPLDEASARGAEREVLAELARSLDREDPGYRVEAAGVLVRRAIIEILGESR
jgi:xanthine dehydrogenase small subunit